MILSADIKHPFYNPMYFDYIVLFNGRELAGCLTADSDNGYVEVYRRDGEGAIITENGIPVMERIKGKVTIVRKSILH